jgi:exosortase/archaeosortase family protein
MSHAIELTRTHGLRAPFAHALRFALWAALLLALLYAPYPADSIIVQLLAGYVALVARASAWLLALGDPSVRLVDEVLITGRFPLQIVLDCTALDVQALYSAAVLSAPLRWSVRLAGTLAGCAALSAINLGRIVVLYWIGVHAPAHFDLMHEDVLTFALLACACGGFWAFTKLAPR